MYDVAVIGCGIIGANVANLLSRYDLRIAILEKENDVSLGTTRANSAIIHAGYDPEPGTQMARLNVRGNELTKKQCGEYDVAYRQIGSLVLAFNEDEGKIVERLYHNGIDNGVPGLKILYKDEILAIEPNLNPDVYSALYAPTAGVVAPWELCLALAEAAVKNGAELLLETQVEAIEKTDGTYLLKTNRGEIRAKVVVNAAGVDADLVEGMVAPPSFTTIPSKGEYYVLDKPDGNLLRHVIFQCPNQDGKGVLVSPTVHGNMIVGPNAEPSARDDVATTAQGLAFVRKQAMKSFPGIPFRDNIRNFAGVRANGDKPDFVIEETLPGFITLGAIKSPGLSSAPAIAEEAAELVGHTLPLMEKPSYVHTRSRKVFKHMTPEEKAEAVRMNPLYGRVICRCESVTEGEIVEALHSPIPPRTIDGVKRRCNAGMGRCQGGFCGPRVHEIIARELGMDQEDVLKDKAGSVILFGETKGGRA